MLTERQREFLEKAAVAAVESERRTSLPAELTVAQAILESGWGQYVPKDSNNLFGIKDTDRHPGSVYVMTTEWRSGSPEKVMQAFEKYPSYADCFRHHAELLVGGPSGRNVYSPHFNVYLKDRDVRGLLWGIAAHYATDPFYATKCWRIIQIEAVGEAIRRARQASQQVHA